MEADNSKRPFEKITQNSQGMIILQNNQILIANKVGKQLTRFKKERNKDNFFFLPKNRSKLKKYYFLMSVKVSMKFTNERSRLFLIMKSQKKEKQNPSGNNFLTNVFELMIIHYTKR